MANVICREKLMFAILSLADRSGGGLHDGKGFNSYDYLEFEKDGPGYVLFCPPSDVKKWFARLMKYRKQMAGYGLDYPNYVLSDTWKV